MNYLKPVPEPLIEFRLLPSGELVEPPNGARLNFPTLVASGHILWRAEDGGLLLSDGTEFKIGETILIESEQLYITGISTNDLTVQRGVNGTTAASHASTTAISISEYPNPVREAVLLEAGLLLETRGYRRQLGNFETGIITPFGRTFSAETRSKLDPFKLIKV